MKDDLYKIKELAPACATHYIVESRYGREPQKQTYLKRKLLRWHIWFDGCGWIRATISGDKDRIKRLT